MSFHQSYQSEFSNRDPAADLKRILQTAAPYGVQLEQAPAAPGQAAWRVLGVHHLTPDENRGRHAVFIDLVDEQGQPLRDPSLRLAWGWAGQRPDERAEPKRFDKPLSEPAANVDVYVGQHIWVQVTGDGLPSDTVVNLHTKHDDELGPNGELWNSTGHHSFYILFQRTARTVIVPPPEAERPRPEPELEVIRFGPFSRQDLINAFARAADALDLDDSWALANRAGLAIADLAADRRARYAGAPLHELPNLSNREKNALKQALAQVLKTMPTPPLESVAPPPVTPEPEPPTPPPAPPVYGNKLG